MKVIASHNGEKAVDASWTALASALSPLDSVVEGVTLVEDDPNELTVGFGGLPNEDGVVELDAAVMDGATHRGGAVACLQGIRHPTRVAQLVLQQTRRVMLAGQGALDFALANGFKQENLLTERARKIWLYWRRLRSNVDDWTQPSGTEFDEEVESWIKRHVFGDLDPEGAHLAGHRDEITGTIHCSVLDSNGDMACATSTSGHAFKMAGRVGDSPLLGAGLYVDNEIGSCGSIGNGEANMENVSSFAAVEAMRRGCSPADAGLEVLERISKKARPDQRDSRGLPNFNLQLYLLSQNGEHAGVSIWNGKKLLVCDDKGKRCEPCLSLYER